jgi:predicted ATPase/DNA-binding winged helix-turn-helix (wHTH) protein
MADPAAVSVERSFSFGSFRLLPSRRLLLDGETPVRLGSRALEILIALIERPGELVGKEELISRVWPSTHVVEGNLKFQVAALRRALGNGRDGRRYLEASPGQGYRFVAAVTVGNEAAPSEPAPAASMHKHNLPGRLTPLLGRAELVARLVEQLPKQRLLTVVGPGGIGKTSVAIAVAERLIAPHKDGVWLVDLGRLANSTMVWSTVAAAVGVEINPEDQPVSLVAALRDKRMLLVLNSCAHVVDAVASLVVAILRSAPGLHILATSREPLRVEGEHVHRLGPLGCPPASVHHNAAAALRFAAVQLFVERAAASLGEFELRDEDAPLVGEICRKLDGIPLAIEFAAARVGVLGVRGLAARLDDRLRLLTGGRRHALPRHRTMRAALDWSYDLLPPSEQTVFRRLAAFAGGFTLAAAAVVADDASQSGDVVVDLVLELATKSLVAADANDEEPRFRLLDTTRAYALEKLAESGECEAIARRHAAYYRDLVEVAAHDAPDEATAGALEIDNIRAALTWAFGPGGDVSIGVRLAADSVPLWISLSLLDECHGWSDKAIAHLDSAGLHGARQEMVLQASLGVSLQFAKGMTTEAHAALSRALELAEHLGDAEYELRIIHTLWVYHMRFGEVRTTLALARRAETLAVSVADPVATQTVDRMVGISLHCAGEHGSARLRLERLLQVPPPASRRSYIRRFGFDQRVIARYVLAQILLLQGFPDQAVQAGRRSVEEARELQHPVTLCGALAWGGSALSLRIGDLAGARQLAAELIDYAAAHSLADYHAFGVGMQAILSLKSRTSDIALEQVRAALDHWRASKWHIYLTMGDFAEVVANAGHVDEVSTIVDETLVRAERNQELWAFPEALRIKGELLLSQNEPNSRLAEDYFARSLDLARSHGALSWELRTATSIARLKRKQGRTEEARGLLLPAYARFTEGFDTADLKRALLLLDELGGAPEQQTRSA